MIDNVQICLRKKKENKRMKNKIIISGGILAAVCLVFTGCSALDSVISKPEPTVLEDTATPIPTPKPTAKPIVMTKEDKIKSNMVEMKLKKVSFTNDIEPEYKFGSYAHYPAAEGRI